MNVMKRKHGTESLRFLDIWCKRFGFPEGGSLSKAQLIQLRWKLQKEKDRLYGKRKVASSDMRLIDDMEKCLKLWENECDKRERQTLQKTMTLIQPTEEKCDKLSPNNPFGPANAPFPPSSSSLYPSLQGGWDSRVDAHMDSSPPPYRAPALDAPQAPAQGPAQMPAQPQMENQLPVQPAQTLTPPQQPLQAPHGTAVENDVTDQLNPVTQPLGAEGPSPMQTRSMARVAQLPMVQVGGPEGNPIYVYRPWTAEDVMQAAKHLPSPDRGGDVLAAAMSDFIRDYTPTSSEASRIMMKKLTPAQFAKVRPAFNAHCQPTTIDWDVADVANVAANVAYRTLRDELLRLIRQEFRVACDLSKVSACIQKADEGPDDFLTRLQSIFEAYSGCTKPDPYPGEPGTPFESLLKTYFINGLHKELSTMTKNVCVGWTDPDIRLSQVARHARHCQQRLQEKDVAAAKKDRILQQQANLTLVQSISTPRRGRGGRGGQQNSRPKGHGDGTCFICQSPEHWARDCPNRGRGRGRGGFQGNQQGGQNNQQGGQGSWQQNYNQDRGQDSRNYPAQSD